LNLPEVLGLPSLYVIYDHPSDYPQDFVCRVWQGELAEFRPFAVARTLEEIRQRLPPGMVCLGRYEQDDPAIREVWI